MNKKENKAIKTLKSYFSNIWYVLGLVAAIVIVVFLIWNYSSTIAFVEKFISIILPFIIGFFLAYLILPLVRLIFKLLNKISKDKLVKVKRGTSIILSYAIVLGFISLLVMYIFPEIKNSIKELTKAVTNGYEYILNNKDDLAGKIPYIAADDALNYLKDNIVDKILQYSGSIVPIVFKFSSSLLKLVYNTFFGIVISIYIILDKDRLVKNFKKIVFALSPKKKEEKVWNTIKQCNHIFNGFLFGKALDSLIIGIITFVAMTILQLPYALLFSLIVCITNMIPYFGPFIGAIPGAVIYLFIDPKLTLIFCIMILCIQQFDGWYLGPKILGDLTGITPLWVIFGITVGGAYFGVLGMFLGVPTTAVLLYLGSLIINSKIKKKKNISEKLQIDK